MPGEGFWGLLRKQKKLEYPRRCNMRLNNSAIHRSKLGTVFPNETCSFFRTRSVDEEAHETPRPYSYSGSCQIRQKDICKQTTCDLMASSEYYTG